MGLLKRGKLIQRYTLPAVFRRRVHAKTDDRYDNDLLAYDMVTFFAHGCTIQNLRTDFDYKMVGGGIGVSQNYVLMTSTPLSAPANGTDDIGCSVYLPHAWFEYDAVTPFTFTEQGGWYRVVRPRNSFNGVQGNCRAYLVKDTVLVDSDGKHKYPDMTAIEAMVRTRAELLDPAWLQIYRDENSETLTEMRESANDLYKYFNSDPAVDGDDHDKIDWDNTWD